MKTFFLSIAFFLCLAIAPSISTAAVYQPVPAVSAHERLNQAMAQKALNEFLRTNRAPAIVVVPLVPKVITAVPTKSVPSKATSVATIVKEVKNHKGLIIGIVLGIAAGIVGFLYRSKIVKIFQSIFQKKTTEPTLVPAPELQPPAAQTPTSGSGSVSPS